MNRFQNIIRSVLLLLVLLGRTLPAAASAQTTAYAVQVTVRDAAGQPVPFLTAAAHDLDGQALATAQTDANGSATLGDLHVSSVRIVVTGQLRDGTLLMLPGADAAGITLALDSPLTPLDLVAEPDGRVAPDPTTMFVREPSGIDAPAPLDIREAPLALPAPGVAQAGAAAVGPTAALIDPAQIASAAPPLSAADGAPAAADDADSAAAWTTYRFILVLAGILLLVGSVVVLLRARRPRRPL